MSKKELALYRDRWQTSEGMARATKVIRALQKNQALDTLGFLDKYEGRWDLRGLHLPSTSVKSGFSTESFTVGFIEDRIEFKKVRLTNLNLSYGLHP